MCLQRPIEPDHLGSPRKVIDPSRGVAVWDWPILGNAFGTAVANDDPDGDGIAVLRKLWALAQAHPEILQVLTWIAAIL